MDNNKTSDSGNILGDIIGFIVAVAVLFFVAKWCWSGILWLLNGYAGLLGMK